MDINTIKQVIYSSINFLLKRELAPEMRNIGRIRSINVSGDFVRISSLELCAFEIEKKGLKGNVAELGVYKGDFAKVINRVFPNRILYLFDTFSGFDNRDIDFEKNNFYSSGNQNFSDTSENYVMSKMKYKDKCMIKKGYFPESAQGVEDEFVFVSIDVDLFKPMMAGLEFFYERLVNGGYIFIHDFNNSEYKGVRKAVEVFCESKKINYFPLSDGMGSAVIMKQTK